MKMGVEAPFVRRADSCNLSVKTEKQRIAPRKPAGMNGCVFAALFFVLQNKEYEVMFYDYACKYYGIPLSKNASTY